jgi:hypothetical protein
MSGVTLAVVPASVLNIGVAPPVELIVAAVATLELAKR